MKPDKKQILQHLEHQFGGDLDGLHNGKIELAYTTVRPDKDGRYPICKAEHFDTDQFEEIADRATELNSDKHCNVYIGQGILREDFKGGRANDSDVIGNTCYWVDIDSPRAADQVKDRYNGLLPTHIVVTGRTPCRRMQLFWRISDPDKIPASLVRANQSLIQHFEGDIGIFNPSRLMRLGGTVNWSNKKGDRPHERTEFVVPSGQGRHSVFPEELERFYPYAEPEGGQEVLALGSGAITPLEIESIIQNIRTDVNWYPNSLRLVAHLVSNSYPDYAIQLIFEPLNPRGEPGPSHKAAIQHFIDSARVKYNIACPEETVEKIDDSRYIAPRPLMEFDEMAIPPRPWVYGTTYVKGNISVLVAPGGVGKSMLTIQQALAVITNVSFDDTEVKLPGKVWIYNNEDDLNMLKSRVYAAMRHAGVSKEKVEGRLFLNSGDDFPLCIADCSNGGMSASDFKETPHVEVIVEQIKANDISLMIVDPFTETHNIPENLNDMMKRVAGVWRRISREADVAICLVHHTGKPPQAKNDSFIGNQFAARGASALPGVARVVHTLSGCVEKDAKLLNIEKDDLRYYVRLDHAKANLSQKDETKYYRWVNVILENGDEIGCLDYVDLVEKREEWEARKRLTKEQSNEVLLWIKTAGPELTKKNLHYFMEGEYEIELAEARHNVESWIENGYLEYKNMRVEINGSMMQKKVLNVKKLLEF